MATAITYARHTQSEVSQISSIEGVDHLLTRVPHLTEELLAAELLVDGELFFTEDVALVEFTVSHWILLCSVVCGSPVSRISGL